MILIADSMTCSTPYAIRPSWWWPGLHARVLGEDGIMWNTATGTPQGGILSPLLANVALSVLDEHFAQA